MGKITFLIISIGFVFSTKGQTDNAEPKPQILKISHAEPLFVDLIRDLGARKGEKEFNLGWEVNEEKNYVSQSGFFEYEFSPMNRLGMEIEIPFNYRYIEKTGNTETLPREKVEGIKLASQYTFLVSEKYNLSMAAGGVYELGLHSVKTISEKNTVLNGHHFDPFFIIAKRWGRHFHSLLYLGPTLYINATTYNSGSQLNLSVHYMLLQTKHLIGLELNRECEMGVVKTTLRPQVKLSLGKGMALGIVTGIPFQSGHSKLDFMMRFIYEPVFKR